ncbi:anti-sigma regulatory factor (Ser/Thr protein kinase) [Catenulispora sp. MAP5-51]|uniref:ATP-binding protein n=1 Tax=Catenulispora sp. MAP5-51 TaxID=3156298 RepID=UPI00351513D3
METKAAGPEQQRLDDAAQVCTAVPLNATAPGAARTFVRETLEDLGLAVLIDDAALLVSELATNALRHAGGEQIDVAVLPEDGRVVFQVFDADAVLPRSREMPSIDPGDTASLPEGGMGLAIIQAVAASWGRCPVPGGKLTWFTLKRPEACA